MNLVEGWTLKEIAASYQDSPQNISKTKKQALKKLNQQMVKKGAKEDE